MMQWKMGDEVLARWTDRRYYRATVMSPCREGIYILRFCDGPTVDMKSISMKVIPDRLLAQGLRDLVKSESCSEPEIKIHAGCGNNRQEDQEQIKEGVSGPHQTSRFEIQHGGSDAMKNGEEVTPEPRIIQDNRHGDSTDTEDIEMMKVLHSENLEDDGAVSGAEDSEVVLCPCGINEEFGFMIQQCNSCFTWQHCECMKLSHENIPDKFFCHNCRRPQGERRSSRCAVDSDWLWRGSLTGMSCLDQGHHSRRVAGRAAVQHLLIELLHVQDALCKLQLPLHVARTQNHPDLKLWSSRWKLCPSIWNPKPLEVPNGSAVGGFGESDIPCGTQCQIKLMQKEHCYHKQTGSPPEERAEEEREELSVQPFCMGGNYSWFHDDVHTIAIYQGAAQHIPHNKESCGRDTLCSVRGVSLSGTRVERSILSCSTNRSGPERRPNRPDGSVQKSQKKSKFLSVKGSSWQNCRISEEKRKRLQIEQLICQQNLVEGIERLQEMVSRRMDFIEENLTELENLFGTNQQDKEDVLREIKDKVQQMIIELQKVRQLAASCVTH